MKARIKEGKLICTGEFSGKRPWVAHVLGLDPERMFERQFVGVRVQPSELDSAMSCASIALPIKDGEVYEFGDWEYSNGVGLRAYFAFVKGQPVKKTRDEVAAFFGAAPDTEVDMPF